MTARLPDSTTEQSDTKPRGRYRAINPAAVASLVMGCLSGLAFLHWFFAIVPLAAIATGLWALRQIDRTPDELTGTGLARAGMVLAALAWIAGSGWLLFVGANEVPTGYRPIDYAELQPNPQVKGERVPPVTADLEGKKVFVKGYMVPGRQQTRLTRFMLCPTNGVCTFHFPDPKPTEMIAVTLCSDLVTDYTTRLVGIGGRFHVDPDDPGGIPYSMEVDYLR